MEGTIQTFQQAIIFCSVEFCVRGQRLQWIVSSQFSHRLMDGLVHSTLSQYTFLYAMQIRTR